MARNTTAPTVTSVAAIAGVSAMTVSRVLRNAAFVSPETRERVLKVVQKVGYRKNEKVIMPAFGNLVPAADDRWRIVQFVRTLGPAK